jgi:hypothetical protein
MPVYLLCDRNDMFIPFTQSRDFAAALTGLDRPHELVEFNAFAHVQIKPGQNPISLLGDGVKLFVILSKVLLVAS